MTNEQIFEKLKAPLPPESIKPHPTKSYLSTIKAIYVTERFNEVFGVEGWHIQTDLIHWFERVTTKGKTEYTAVCKTTFASYNGIRHECIAGSTNEDLGDAAKGATTDAITKIGSYIGVGADVFKGLSSAPAPKPVAAKPAPKPTASKKELDWLNPGTPNWEYAKKRVSEGVTIETIKKTFRLSKENEDKLKAHETAPLA